MESNVTPEVKPPTVSFAQLLSQLISMLFIVALTVSAVFTVGPHLMLSTEESMFLLFPLSFLFIILGVMGFGLTKDWIKENKAYQESLRKRKGESVSE